MQEIAPGLNGSLEHEEVDDEEEQQHQDDSIEDDEPLRHGMDEHEQNNSFHNGSAKDVLIEDGDVKDSPNASAGKSSSSGGKIFIGGLSWDTSTGTFLSFLLPHM